MAKFKEEYWFFSGFVGHVLSVHKRTIHNWLKSGKITAFRNGMNGYYQFSLDEINRVLTLQGRKELSKDEIRQKWVEYYYSDDTKDNSEWYMKHVEVRKI